MSGTATYDDVMPRPAFYALAMQFDYAKACKYVNDEGDRLPRETCGEAVRRLEEFLADPPPERTAEQLAHVQHRLECLAARDGEEALWSLTDFLRSDEPTEEQKFCVRWQHRDHLDLDQFELGLMHTLTYADDSQLNRLALAYPIEVEGLRRWRGEQGFSDSVRDFPIDFTL